MGLDVIVYGNVRLADDEKYAKFIPYVASERWKYKIQNLQEWHLYTGDVIYKGVSYTYSTHDKFRQELIKLIDRLDLLDGNEIKFGEIPYDIPFYDFIDFSDCEGCFDWECANIIYLDFERFKEKAKSFLNEYYYSIYETWLETFKAAKNHGVVVFC